MHQMEPLNGPFVLDVMYARVDVEWHVDVSWV